MENHHGPLSGSTRQARCSGRAGQGTRSEISGVPLHTDEVLGGHPNESTISLPWHGPYTGTRFAKRTKEHGKGEQRGTDEVRFPLAAAYPQAIDALRAGKDVYCEKPLTHWSQFELAKKVQEAADKTRRLVQVGTQHMADDNYPEIIKLVRQGIIGKPMHVMCSYFRNGDWGERMSIPDTKALPGPDLLWDRFLGDAPKVDFTLSRFFQWRMYWDYAGGPATDLLVHTFTPIFCILELGYPEPVFEGETGNCALGSARGNR